jgi:type I restriction enzyme S subunit
MKLETFFEKFDRFADAPGAVEKMRELVMWSAFSGAFSSEKRDQPMPEEWAIEGAPTLPAIPSSWRWQRGSEVFQVIRGVSYKKDDASNTPVEGSFPLLRANNIGNEINFEDLVYVPGTNIRDDQFIRRGDILIAMSSGSKKLVGKAAPIVSDFTGAFGAFCGVIRNKSEMPDDVLARYFQSPQYTSWVTAAGRGIGINNLGKSDLDSLPIPTPPVPEQKRIVAKVDDLMGLCDQFEAQQQERETRHAALTRASLARFADGPTPANLSFLFHSSYPIPPADLRKSIYQAAFDGVLTAHPRSVAAPKAIPTGWVVREIASLCVIEDGDRGRAYPKKADFSEAGYCVFLNTKNVTRHGFDFSKLEWISEKKHQQLRKGTLVRGDIVFTSRGTIGNVAHYDDSVPFDVMRINSGMFILRGFQKHMEASFLSRLLRSPQIRTQIDSLRSGSAQPQLPIREFKKFTAKIPPLSEQRRIVAKVDGLMAWVDELETQLAACRATAANLLSALVADLTTTSKE